MEAPILDALSKVYKPDKLQVINPPPLAIGAGNVDVDEDDEDAGDIENNAEEEIEKVVAAVDGEEEDGEYVGDDDDGGQGGRLPIHATSWKFLDSCTCIGVLSSQI